MSIGEDIGKLGFGLMRLPMIGDEVDFEQTCRMTDLFLEKGFNYFDTAYGYIDGKSEAAARKALVERHPRDSFLLATKLPAWAGPTTAKEARDMFWTSLKRTGVEFFDFYLLHNLGAERTEFFDRFGLWDFLAEQKAAGRIRRLGFSMHASASVLEDILTRHPEMEFVQLQINYSDWENGIVQSRKNYETARKFNKPIIVMEPVKGGALANLPEPAAKLLAEAAPGASPASLAIRYAASLDGVATVLSGMSTLDQMRDNLAAMENFRPLDAGELAVIGEARKILASIPQVPCTDCRYCLKDCPRDIAIPGAFRAFNDYLAYRRMAVAKGTYGFETRIRNKASECIRCGNCEAVCPQGIRVIEELARAAEILEG